MLTEQEIQKAMGDLRVPACPFAVFDEFGDGADDRVRDYAAKLVAGTERRYTSLLLAVEGILDDGHMNQEQLARLRSAWEEA